jgi:DNA-binding NarL/FixJ family response regulator
LGQDPEHGLALLRAIRTDYPNIPIVFYSRKITPEYAVRALRAGAADVVQKGALETTEVLERFRTVAKRRA